MNRELAQLLLMRKALNSISSGVGVSASIVKTFATGGEKERQAARKILLGNPPLVALEGISSPKAKELSMLAGLMAAARSGSAREMGRRGEALSAILEGWLKAREARLLERRVLQARGYIMSAVLGAVVGMLTTLGPMVGSLSLLQGGQPSPNPYLVYASGAMVALSSSALGIFLGGRRFYIDLLVAGLVFLMANFAAAPLAVLPAVSPWAIK